MEVRAELYKMIDDYNEDLDWTTAGAFAESLNAIAGPGYEAEILQVIADGILEYSGDETGVDWDEIEANAAETTAAPGTLSADPPASAHVRDFEALDGRTWTEDFGDAPTLQRVFVYGTLKSGQGNNKYYMRNARLIGPATTVPGFKLYHNGSYPMMVATRPPGDTVVVGEVWEVDSATLAELDRMEAAYSRQSINLQGGGSALAYLYTRNLHRALPCGPVWPDTAERPDDWEGAYRVFA